MIVVWWNDLWLNEGFVFYVEYLGVDYVEFIWNLVSLWGLGGRGKFGLFFFGLFFDGCGDL